MNSHCDVAQTINVEAYSEVGGCGRDRLRVAGLLLGGFFFVLPFCLQAGTPVVEPPPAVADTVFSHRAGFYEAPFELTIQTETPNAIVRYTLDGSPPSLEAGEFYQNPISIATTAIVRAIAFKDGLEPTNIDTSTYLFLEDVIRQPLSVDGWPRPSLSVGQGSKRHDYEMDPEIVGEGEQAEAVVRALLALPTMSLVVHQSDMWNNRGTGGFYRGDSEAPVSVEVLYPGEPERNIQSDGAVQGHSHDRLKRSLRLKFKEEFGERKFETSILREAPLHGEFAVDRFDRLILRAGNNRSWARSWNPDKTAYTMDQWYRDTQIAMTGYGSRGTFMHLYINGLYWGLYNLCERLDTWYTSANFGGEPDDWFAVSHGGDQGGIDDRWDALIRAARTDDLSDPAEYEAVASQIDLSGFIDYILVSWYIGVTDWPQNNWWAGMDLQGDGKVRFFAWDGEWCFGLGSSPPAAWVHTDFRNRVSRGRHPISYLWHGLRQNPEFMMLVADRAQRHCRNSGALTDSEANARWQRLNAFVKTAVLAESARWGDALSSQPRTVEEDWQNEVDRIDERLEGNANLLIDRMRSENYFPGVEAPTITVSGSRVEVIAPVGAQTMMVTANGSDPRVPGGDANASAVEAKELYRLDLTATTTIKARTLKDGEWSGLSEQLVVIDSIPLRLSEIMYHPAPPTDAEVAAGCFEADDFEYLRFTNIGKSPFNVENAGIVAGVRFRFPDTIVVPGESVIVARDRNAFALRYGTSHRLIGQYHDRLSNAGESLLIRDQKGGALHNFTYDDAWHPDTDGKGLALEIVNLQLPLAAWNSSENWRSVAPLNMSEISLQLMPHINPGGSRSVRVSGPGGTRITLQISEDLVGWVDHEAATIDESGAITIDLVAFNQLQSVFVRARMTVEP